MATPFSDSLVRLRRQAGFPTAYRFFHDNGGGKVLGTSYRQYLLWEQGRSLPPAPALEKLAPALRLLPGSGGLCSLASDWLRTLAGETAYAAVFASFLPAPRSAPGLSPLHKAVSRALDDKKYPLSVDQAAGILATREHYKAFLFMINDRGDWSGREAAGILGVTPAAAAAVFRDFLRLGLLKKGKSDRFRCVLSDAMVEFPRAELLPQGCADRMEKYQRELLDSGKNAWCRRGFLRADARDFADFFPVMSLNLSTASTYSVTEKTPHSAMFAVEGRIVKLKDF